MSQTAPARPIEPVSDLALATSEIRALTFCIDHLATSQARLMPTAELATIAVLTGLIGAAMTRVQHVTEALEAHHIDHLPPR